MGHNRNQNLTRILHLLFLYLSLPNLIDLASADIPYHTPCVNTTTNSPILSPIHNNLNTLLSSLSTTPSFPKQYNTSIGNDPDTRVYVQYMCLNYETNASCKACVESASEVIRQACPGDRQSTVWEETCQLTYSDRNFVGRMDASANEAYSNARNVSGSIGEEFGLAVNGTLSGLARQAAYDGSGDRYATGAANISDLGMMVYGLVQCTRDLSPGDCHTCLMVALANVSSCCYLSRGARVFGLSCYLRYELYNFYIGEAPPASELGGTRKGRKWRNIVISTTVALMVVAIIIFGSFLCCLAKRKKIQNSKKNGNVNQEVQLPDIRSQSKTNYQQFGIQGTDRPRESAIFNFATILEATDNFSDANLLGGGGFGPVYKGMLTDGQEVAVKRLSSCSDQGNEEFTNEVLLIMKLQHKNLVRLLGFCIDGEEKLLVYEFMPNGSLDVILFDATRRAELDWNRRVGIINGIAKGILYLHEDSRLRIVHRDLKASNVLLDNNMNPKISDFGMARIFGGNESDSSSTARIVGTYGYMAPEYAMEGIYSTKSDVFSFGVILIEIISGRRNMGFHQTKLASSLVAYAWQLWKEKKEQELVDPYLSESCGSDDFSWYMRIGLLCVQEDANDRPTMSSVVLMLKNDRDIAALPQPAQRSAFSPGGFLDESEDNTRQ